MSIVHSPVWAEAIPDPPLMEVSREIFTTIIE